MDPFDVLSKREREVANLVLEGKSNKQIAFALQITDNTVEFHLKNIYSKFQVSSRAELIIKLRNSVVAGKEGIVENKEQSKVLDWFLSMREAVSRTGKEFQMENVSDPTTRSGVSPMTFFESIRVCLLKYAEFQGRASRSEFWWFTLAITLVTSALTYISETAGSVFLIAVLLPLLAVGARRLHDIGKSGWWLLFLLAPVGGIVLVGILCAQPPASAQPDDTSPG